MKREKENQIILAKSRPWMISFSFGQLSGVSTSIQESTVSSISNNFSFRDSLKDFFALFFRVAGIPFQILTPTRENAFRVALMRDSFV